MSAKGTVIVTGGGRGIGAASARLLAARGHGVAISYLSNAAAAHRVVEDITGRGGRAIAVPADAGSEADTVRLFETARAALGPLSGLVNNAGIVSPSSRLEEMDAGRLERILRTNVIGAFLACREAVRAMSTRHGGGGGAIVNVSSVAARLGSPGEFIDYAATKGALDSLTIGLAREVAAEGIRVNAIRPGIILTEIHASAGDPERVARIAPATPMGRAGTAEECAEAIAFLLSDAASYTTGSFIEVSGGR
ncbi:MAG: SDR family oxidoreductase [Hyphomicrobiaceae bacterium]